MLTVFYLLAGVMILGALAIVLVPIIAHGQHQARSRGVFVAIVAVVVVLPLIAVGIYHDVGTPSAVLASVRNPPPPTAATIAKAVSELKQRLNADPTNPKNLKGWLLLGKFYASGHDNAAARGAYGHALKLAPDNAAIMIAWVAADSMARPDHLIAGASRARLQHALKLDPRNQRGLWLMGISDYQAGHFVDAALTWRQLQVMLAPNSDVANAVSRQIAMANARADGKTQAEAEALLTSPGAAAPSPASAASTASTTAPRIEVSISIDPTLKAHVKGSDTLYVYARAANGSPVPLAVKRLKVSDLPATITLDDATAMSAGHDLSSARKVALTARISRDGRAAPQPGDLEGSTGPLDVGPHTAARIVINRTL